MVMNGAVNRDPRVFSDGARFDAKRSNVRRNIAFGTASTFCPGASLARAEARISFERLLAQLDDLDLVDGARSPTRRASSSSCLNDLPLRFRAAPTEGGSGSSKSAART